MDVEQGELGHDDGDELQQLLSAVERIADSIGGMHELAVAIVSRPDFTRAAALDDDAGPVIRELRDELQRARTAQAEVIILPVGIVARALTLIGRLRGD